ncbi:MAG: GGDEF domain-containing protein [Methylococcaceae bacterium]|nr:GGDEF domain-containing protein [Methylococcaceae bacterium]
MTTLNKTEWVQLHNYRIYLVINTIAYLGIVVHLILIPLFYWLNQILLSLLNVLSSLMWIGAWLVNRRGSHNSAVFLMTSELILHTTLVVPIAGWHTGFQYYLFAAIPFTLFNNKLAGYTVVMISVAMCVLFMMLDIYTHDQAPNLVLSSDLVSIINNINIIISFTALCVISYFFRLASLQLEEELEKQAYTDPLTGLYNRRSMTDFLTRQAALSVRNQSNLTIIFVDIDHFKKINDTYGHDCGDSILGAVANFIRQHLRKTDTLARWGGEEFLILLPDTDLNGARAIAEKIRAAITEQRFSVENYELTVTLTFGVCQHAKDRPIEDSIKCADIALYNGKQAGRNIVMSYPDRGFRSGLRAESPV